MAFLSFEQVVADDTVKTVSALTIPSGANQGGAELQASGQNVSYTMDGATNPAQTSGMFLLTTSEPKQFLIEDLRNIRFTRAAGSNGNLNVHYYGGRDV